MASRKGRLRVQYQLDSLDCGPCCLGMIATYYGRTYHRQRVRRLCEQDLQGSSLGALVRAAEELGFRAKAVRTRAEKLQHIPFPCIAYLPRGHYVVIDRVARGKVHTLDPSLGYVDYSLEEFAQIWHKPTSDEPAGALLLLEPAEHLQPSDPKQVGAYRYVVRPLLQALKASGLPLFAAAVILLIGQAALPFLSAALVDAGIRNADVSLLFAVLLGQAVLLISRAAAELLQGWVLAYVGAQLHTTLVSQFLRKFSRLPFSFFGNKRVGDTLQRVEDHHSIQELLIESAAQILIVLTSFLVFGIVLFIFSPLLFGIYLAGSAAYVLYSGQFLRSLRRFSYKTFSQMSDRQSSLLQFLCGMQEIKLNNASDYYRREWEKKQVALARSQVKVRLLGLTQHAGGTLLNEIKNATLVVVAANEVVHGGMTLGMMLAVQYVVAQLNWPLTQAIGLMTRAGNASTSFERAQEVHLLEDEDAHVTSPLQNRGREGLRLIGVSFRYRGNGLQGDVLRSLSLTIEPGKTTAIVGASGSGKTTLMRVLLKMNPTDEGRIMIGATDLACIEASSWRDACGAVLQDGFVFSDTILNNITLGREPRDMASVREACRIAMAEDFIDALPLGFETRIGGEGAGLSRGQLQRILIARALYRDPQYIFLDEATSALDAETEYRVSAALNRALEGRTAVIIAHRLSTIRRAHKIVVLASGRIVEEGDHDSLIEARGHYYGLVKHQLEAEEHRSGVAAVI